MLHMTRRAKRVGKREIRENSLKASEKVCVCVLRETATERCERERAREVRRELTRVSVRI